MIESKIEEEINEEHFNLEKIKEAKELSSKIKDNN
jgi:hypothetical protein